ncbi:hypothetical protein ABZY81_30835 [Streptomyces sp. NPDC006514]|uniref:hypothetical protein n=1 Tax=Streptomyces sp. NPDC006514 TaxID=3154308 RepID=UPI0033B1C493
MSMEIRYLGHEFNGEKFQIGTKVPHGSEMIKRKRCEMLQYVQTEFVCPGAYVQWATVTSPQGAVASIGFQSQGYAQELFVNQMFVMNSTTAFIQVHNSSLTDTTWWAWLVVDVSEDADLTEIRSQLQVQVQEEAVQEKAVESAR